MKPQISKLTRALHTQSRKEQVNINDRWFRVNLTPYWSCPKKDLDTPKYSGAVWAGCSERRSRNSEEKGKGHPVLSLWAIYCSAELKPALGSFSSWWIRSTGGTNIPFPFPFWDLFLQLTHAPSQQHYQAFREPLCSRHSMVLDVIFLYPLVHLCSLFFFIRVSVTR